MRMKIVAAELRKSKFSPEIRLDFHDREEPAEISRMLPEIPRQDFPFRRKEQFDGEGVIFHEESADHDSFFFPDLCKNHITLPGIFSGCDQHSQLERQQRRCEFHRKIGVLQRCGKYERSAGGDPFDKITYRFDCDIKPGNPVLRDDRYPLPDVLTGGPGVLASLC